MNRPFALLMHVCLDSKFSRVFPNKVRIASLLYLYRKLYVLAIALRALSKSGHTGYTRVLQFIAIQIQIQSYTALSSLPYG